jgi:hypothetical protein
VRKNHDAAEIAERKPERNSESFRDEYWTQEEFCKDIDRSVWTLLRWWRAGSGPPFAYLGSRRIIPKCGGREWLRLRQITPPRQG